MSTSSPTTTDSLCQLCPSRSICSSTDDKLLKKSDDVSRVLNWIGSDLILIAQTAPSVRVHLGEVLGGAPDDYTRHLVAGLRFLGFQYVLDTQFGADLTVVEEAAEFLDRLVNQTGPLPMFTSCCPAWMNYVEKNFPNVVPNVSTTKSPHIMMGTLIKTWWAGQKKLDVSKIRVVSIMPCLAKKAEIQRPELKVGEFPPVDAVLTIRELGSWLTSVSPSPLQMLEQLIQNSDAEYSSYDQYLGVSSGSGTIFSRTGGVMMASLRTVMHMLGGTELPQPEFKDCEEFPHVKEAQIELPLTSEDGSEHKKCHVAVVSGISGVKKLLAKIDDVPYVFIEYVIFKC
ncbi:hypothetical protein GEMRC1_010094 [Eukaryota sp. GEM-RC1]